MKIVSIAATHLAEGQTSLYGLDAEGNVYELRQKAQVTKIGGRKVSTSIQFYWVKLEIEAAP